MEKITFVDLSGFLNRPLEVTDSRIFVGRGSDICPNDVGLIDYTEKPISEDAQNALLTVSRCHFMIEPGGSIRDCNSLNGTYVNKKLVGPTDRVYLNHGDIVEAGAFRFKTLLDGGEKTIDFVPSILEDTIPYNLPKNFGK